MKNNILLFLFVVVCVLIHLLFLKFTRWQLPSSDIQKPLLIQGVIDSVPEKKFHGLRFVFQTINTRMLISWYAHPPALKIGQRWNLFVKLKPPIGSHNPGGFDYAAFLEAQGISATGYVVARRDENKLLGNDHFYFLSCFRERIQNEISAAISNHSLAAFVSALCVGLRAGLTESNWRVFQKTGTNHLIAIAGLHIGFVAGFIYFLIDKTWRTYPRALLWLPAARAAEIAALIAAIGYTMLSGFAVPAQRASIMLFCFLMSRIFCWPLSMWRRWFFAASIILIVYPYDLTDASFWLSFMSIAVLAFVLTGRLRAETGYRSHLKMQAAILVGLLPLMLLLFQQISLIAFFANMIAIPWVGFMILPVALLSTLLALCHLDFLSQYGFLIAGKLLLPLWKLLSFASHLSFASWYHAINNDLILTAGVIGAFFLLAPRGLPARYVGCFGLLPIFFYHPYHPKMGDFRATVIDVGQGLSVLVQTAHHVMLYDTGAHFPGGFDYGESVVAPYLRYRDVSVIDRLEISHGDNDHSGGANAIIKDFQVKSIFTSAPKLISQLHAQTCFAGQSWTWDQVHFVTLYPEQNTPYADNNSSCVIQVSNGKTQLLLTGDIEKPTEYALINQYPTQLRSTVLVVPHHGSKTSSSTAFIKAVSPHYAIISAGMLNRYHLPSQAVLARYQQNHITVYNTANSGAIMIRFLRDGRVILTQNE